MCARVCVCGGTLTHTCVYGGRPEVNTGCLSLLLIICFCYFPVTVIKSHHQKQRTEGFIPAYDSRGIESITAGRHSGAQHEWWQKQEAESSHLQPEAGSRGNKPEVYMRLFTLSASPSEATPPLPPQTAPSAGDQVFKCSTL